MAHDMPYSCAPINITFKIIMYAMITTKYPLDENGLSVR